MADEPLRKPRGRLRWPPTLNGSTLRGQGTVVCGDETANALYEIEFIPDGSGRVRASGSLRVNTPFALKAALAPYCRLIFEDEREIAVRIDLCDDETCRVEGL